MGLHMARVRQHPTVVCTLRLHPQDQDPTVVITVTVTETNI